MFFYLPGAHWASEEYPFSPEHPVPALLGKLAQLGIASLRVERFGMGDSEGPPCTLVDFDTEYRGYRAGLALLSRVSWCVPERVLLFGHSLGAMVAPLLTVDDALPVAPRGVITFGASALPISAGLDGALQRYAKVQPDVSAQTIERQCELIRLIVAGPTTSRISLTTTTTRSPTMLAWRRRWARWRFGCPARRIDAGMLRPPTQTARGGGSGDQFVRSCRAMPLTVYGARERKTEDDVGALWAPGAVHLLRYLRVGFCGVLHSHRQWFQARGRG